MSGFCVLFVPGRVPGFAPSCNCSHDHGNTVEGHSLIMFPSLIDWFLFPVVTLTHLVATPG